MKIFLLVWALLATLLSIQFFRVSLEWDTALDEIQDLAWDALIHDKKLHIKLEECETELLNRRML